MGLNCTRCKCYISKFSFTGEHDAWCDKQEEEIEATEQEQEELKEALVPTLTEEQLLIFTKLMRATEYLASRERRGII